MIFTPTAEQIEIVDFMRSRSENLIIEALAGAAKTTTLELCAKALTHKPILYLVFNKRNADEATKRLPAHVASMTFNACGHRAWSQAQGRRLTVEKDKDANILKAKIASLNRKQQSEAWDSFSEILKAIRLAKIHGYVPSGLVPGLREEDTFEEFDPTELEFQLFDATLRESIRMSFNGFIDFNDQLYMPVLFGGTWSEFPLVLADEAQDLSPINHKMLNYLVTNRFAAVGDRFQSVYAFRGAVSNGMDRIQKHFNMETRHLSTSFRCPISIVKRAQGRAPNMRWPDWAIEGLVDTLPEFTHETFKPGSAVICRNNAPLFRLGLKLLINGIGVRLVGSDIGPGLVRILKKLGPETMSQTETLDAIDEYETTAAPKSRAPSALADKCECLRTFARQGRDLGSAVAYAESLFSSNGTIQLLSGHKAKGLEWDVVYHLDPWRIPSPYAEKPEELEQEENIRYVIETRAKRELYLISNPRE